MTKSNKVYFANEGLIDLDVIRVMGVNVKVTDNPIGHFGTGLKFAIATLLRTGHEITLYRGGDVYCFKAVEELIRGEKFQRVYMGDEKLAFTTDLGRNWEPWQAYRELHSNTLDEGGKIAARKLKGDTVILVEGEGIRKSYNERSSIFLQSKPLAATKQLEVHPGKTAFVYYRGVRAGRMPSEAQYTYNILTHMDLTEDRTFGSQWDVEWKLRTLIPAIENVDIHHDILSGTKGFDQALDFSIAGSPSPAFLKAAAQTYQNANANRSVKRLVEKEMQAKAEFPPAKLSDQEADLFLLAFEHTLNMGCTLSPEDCEVVTTLGPNVMGLYHKGKDRVFIAHSVLDWGLQTIVATLYEEWLHKEHGYVDQSRELQNFLLQRMVALSMGQKPPEPGGEKPDEPPAEELF